MADDQSKPRVQFFHGTPDLTPYVPGRRTFFQYRDLGLERATQGMMRAQILEASAAMDRATGWHYHTCDIQFNYLLEGWADLQFEDGTEFRLKAGDSILIPGGMIHNELRTSAVLKAIEYCVPANMGTVAADEPAAWRDRVSQLAE